MMPVMDGRTFRRAQVRDPTLAEIPVIVLSAMPVPENGWTIPNTSDRFASRWTGTPCCTRSTRSARTIRTGEDDIPHRWPLVACTR